MTQRQSTRNRRRSRRQKPLRLDPASMAICMFITAILCTICLISDSNKAEAAAMYYYDYSDVVISHEVSNYGESSVYEDAKDDYVYTEEDLQYLTMIIVGEAQNCSYKEQMYVGSVALNRLHNKKYFDYGSIKEVALAPGQYASFWGEKLAYRDPTDTNIEVAETLIKIGSILPENVIFQALFVQGDGIYERINDTYFCYKD